MRVLVTGGRGMLGTDLVAAARARGHQVRTLSRSDPDPCDLTDAAAVRARIALDRPELVLHAAAWTAVDACESDPARAMAVNGEGARSVAEAAAEVGAHVLYVSTDYVFDGTKASAYVEDDPPAPTSAYGRSKLAGEEAMPPDATIARVSWLCGQHGPNMVATIVRLASGPGPLRFVADQVGNPTFTADVAPLLVELAEARAGGIWHTTNQGAVSWYEFAREVLDALGEDPDRVEPISTAELDPPRPATRPANSVLRNAALEAAGRPLLRHHALPLAALVGQLRP